MNSLLSGSKAMTHSCPTKQPQTCPGGLPWSCSTSATSREAAEVCLEQGVQDSQWKGTGMFPPSSPRSRCVSRYTPLTYCRGKRRSAQLFSPLSFPPVRAEGMGVMRAGPREGREPGRRRLCSRSISQLSAATARTNNCSDKQLLGQTTARSPSQAIQDQDLSLGQGKHNSEGIKDREMSGTIN